ncbi:AraC-type DNA-binding protein [Mucilaginibacter lappiensis]|uniref:AraC-like DNA-binding protein n=1 Tax=Mucilaginibacter lappiensis TaxID=354630 RepID=A0ABR6PKH2_9SPHI|nr:AraC family transcriptional regulator [Mucilaginibacter lappiensis]MBB6110267.1 AraC-like DNA-binding protein [Mucilaginibacter lappiensis]SIR28475.1 AraC-type DNA-binding protein [Mucilaginibacter lappiensis]
MGINVSKNYGTWKKVGGSFEHFPMREHLVIERKEKYSFSFSDAELVQITTPDIYIVYGDVMFKQHQLYFRPTNDVPDMIKLRFTLSGNGTIYNYVNNQKYLFNSNQQNIIYMPQLDGIGEYDTRRNYRFFEVHFAKEKFLQLSENSCRALQVLADHVDGGRYAQIAEQELPISSAMHDCIHGILNCNYIEGLKVLFLQSKCIELLVLQADAFEMAVTKKQNFPLKSTYDKDCIYYARDYLIQNIHQPPSVAQLSKVCGINEFKLKQGFKALFDSSVFGYLSDYKLNYAKELLLDGKSIKSVAFELGYSSVQHFSTAFRKKFAVSPGKVKT